MQLVLIQHDAIAVDQKNWLVYYKEFVFRTKIQNENAKCLKILLFELRQNPNRKCQTRANKWLVTAL